jgi:hypothetical protein
MNLEARVSTLEQEVKNISPAQRRGREEGRRDLLVVSGDKDTGSTTASGFIRATINGKEVKLLVV